MRQFVRRLDKNLATAIETNDMGREYYEDSLDRIRNDAIQETLQILREVLKKSLKEGEAE